MSATASVTEKPMVVLDLGSRRSREIRRLRRGRGRLMRRVSDTIEQLKQNDEIDASSQIVVVVVKQKRRSRSWFW